MRGIVAYGAYVPHHRLAREEIAKALGASGGAGTRSVAGYDEDTTSLAVEAGRRALWDGARPHSLHFATTAPAYADKTNATAIHAALRLARDCPVADAGASVRCGAGAMRAAAAERGIAILADIRYGRPGSADEREGGDGAAAFLFGEGEGVLAEILGGASRTEEFLDRWRAPGESFSRVWEERFGLELYLPLVREASEAALGAAGLERADHVIVSSPHLRAAATAARSLPGGEVADDLIDGAGYAGTAHAGLVLCDVLDRARPGESILLAIAADGCDATVLRATEALVRRPAAAVRDPVRGQLERGGEVSYARFLTWRGTLEREPPRRPDPRRPEAPPSAGSSASSARAARGAAPSTSRPSGCACAAGRWTGWRRSRSPTPARRSRRSRSIGWPTRSPHPRSTSCSTSTAAGATSAR
jgi:3-hydroxy-3-methylglutaryl CoA synthase